MKSCSAYGCTYRFKKSDGKQFHRFPFTRPNIVKKWIEACKRKNWTPSRWSLLCSDHFTDDDYQLIPGCSRRYLREDAVPSIFNFPPRLVKRNTHWDNAAVSVNSGTESVNKKRSAWVKDVGTQSFIRSKDMCTQNCPVLRHASTQIRVPSVKEILLRRKVKVLQERLKYKNMQLKAAKKLLNPTSKDLLEAGEVFSFRNDVSRSATSEIPVYTLKVDLFE